MQHYIIRKRILFVFASMILLLPSCENPTQAQVTRITFAGYANQSNQYEPLIATFHQQHPTITVQFVAEGSSGSGPSELASLADTTILDSPLSSADSPLFLDLSPLMGSAGFDSSSFWPGALQGCQTGEAAKGLPVSVRPYLIQYNQAAFTQAGLALPQPGWTWEDFKRDAQALSSPKATPPHYGFLENATSLTLGPQIDQALASGAGPQELAARLQWHVDLVRQGEIAGADIAAQQGWATLIKNHQAALWIGTLSSLTNDLQGVDFSVGMAPFPTIAGTQASNPGDVSCAVISAGTRSPAASFAWIEFLSQQAPLDQISFSAPARMALADSSGYWQQLKPESVPVVKAALEHGWYGWAKPDVAAVAAAIRSASQSGGSLTGALSDALGQSQTQSSTPTEGISPVVIAAPTDTAGPVTKPANVPSAVYFADPWYHTSFQAVQALADAFNRSHPDMFIEVTDTRPDPNYSGMSNMYDATHFDCFASGSGAGQILSFQETGTDLDFIGKIYSLDPFLDSSDASWLADLYSPFLEAARSGGHLYGLPVALSAQAIYYNASLLKGLGLAVPQPDWTAQDLWTLATTIAERKPGVYGYVPYYADPLYLLSSASYTRWGQEWPAASFEDPGVVNLLAKLAPLAKSQALFPIDQGGTRSPLGNLPDRDTAVFYGKAGLWSHLIGSTYGMDREGTPNFDVGLAPFPSNQPINLTNGVSLYISRQAKNPQVCWAWLKFLSDQPVNLFQGIPARQSVLASDFWAAAIDPERAAVYRATLPHLKFTEEVHYAPPTPLAQWWSDALAAVMQAGKEPAVVLKAIQFKAQATLDCMAVNGTFHGLTYDQSYQTVSIDQISSVAESCAHAADPNYHTIEELFKLNAKP